MTWGRKVTLAAITGLISGAVRALSTWVLEHLASTC
jgi:hypothetical protein